MYEKALMAQAKKYARRGATRGVDEGAKRYGLTETVAKLKVNVHAQVMCMLLSLFYRHA